MKRILVIFGTRPEAIKMAPVVKTLEAASQFDVRVCVTAQHREMLDQVLNFFKITPDFDLNLMQPNQSLTGLTARIFESLGPVFQEFKPDLVFVHGDTTTTMAASLAAFQSGAKIAHVEAGLRSGSMMEPWPEEANRRVTSVVTDLHFAPTDQARGNLLAEHHDESKIFVTGNTVIDALLAADAMIEGDRDLLDSLNKKFSKEITRDFALVTVHRRENFGQGLLNICEAIKKLVSSQPINVVLPVHPNPNVQKYVVEHLQSVPGVFLHKPFEYQELAYLLKRAKLVLTDSGGLQEEAPSFGVPVLVLRNTTERPEAMQAGTALLVGTDVLTIVDNATRLLTDPQAYNAMARAINPFGDGTAARQIADKTADYLATCI